MRYIKTSDADNADKGRHAFLLLLSSIDTDALTVAAIALEANLTVDHCEQCIIRTDTDIVARMDVCAALTNKNITRQNILTVAALYAKALCFGITAVLGRANALLVSEELHTDTQHLDCTSVIKYVDCPQHSAFSRLTVIIPSKSSASACK